MPFNFSFSSSATFVSTSSTSGQTQGWAYRRDAYSTDDGSGVRTTRQNLGEAPVTQTRMFDAHGRPLLVEGSSSGGASRSRHQSKPGPSMKIISIEDVTEEEDKKAREASRQ